MGEIRLVRVYDYDATGSGPAYLVERLWPRGVRRDDLALDGWLKAVAPSTELRKWFSHDPKKWPEFRRRYYTALRSHPETWRPLLSAARRGRVTLVYAARDVRRNGAVALKAFLDRRL